MSEPLVAVVTTDLAAVTRGRTIAAGRLDKIATTGLGWVPANLSLTAFGTIVSPNPWGSAGDLRLVPDPAVRFRADTGAAMPFDMVPGDLVALDGAPWAGCTRTMLKDALAALEAETGLSVLATFEQEFVLEAPGLAAGHSFGLDAVRAAEPFPTRLMAALTAAGAEPEMVIAEYGARQFEVTHAPADALGAADRCVATREIARDVARALGWRASFVPKPAPDVVGNGVHIHLSLVAADGTPATWDAGGPGGLSPRAGAFCAGVVRHLPALTALTAPSVGSYYRLVPHSWSASYTWLAERDREAALRICPVVAFGGRDPARQFNVEYRPADGTGNPYLALAAIVRAGLAGIRDGLAPTLFAGDPELVDAAERERLGLRRLPTSLDDALDALDADPEVAGWFAPAVLETFAGIKRDEIDRCVGLDPASVCDLYRAAY